MLTVTLNGIPMWNIFARKQVRIKLYSLWVLKRAGVDEMSILKVYLTTIRPVLEYAIPVWQAIPDYLSDKIKSPQKRVLHIVFPYIDTCSYNSALLAAGLETLEHRRNWLWDQYMKRITTNTSHPLNAILPRIRDRLQPVLSSCASFARASCAQAVNHRTRCCRRRD